MTRDTQPDDGLAKATAGPVAHSIIRRVPGQQRDQKRPPEVGVSGRKVGGPSTSLNLQSNMAGVKAVHYAVK